MPLPKPRPNEQRVDFINRCVGDKVMLVEYPDSKQRVAVCYSLWREHRGEAKDSGGN